MTGVNIKYSKTVLLKNRLWVKTNFYFNGLLPKVLESTQGEEKPSTSYLPLPLPLPLPLHPITKKTTIHIISRSDSDDDDDRSHEEGKHGFEFVWEMEVQILGVSGHVSSGVLVHVHRHRLAPLVCHSQFPFQRHWHSHPRRRRCSREFPLVLDVQRNVILMHFLCFA